MKKPLSSIWNSPPHFFPLHFGNNSQTPPLFILSQTCFLNRRRNPRIEADELRKLAYILHYESKNDRDSIKRWSDV